MKIISLFISLVFSLASVSAAVRLDLGEPLTPYGVKGAMVTADGNWIKYEKSLYQNKAVTEKGDLTFKGAVSAGGARITESGNLITFNDKVYDRVKPAEAFPAKDNADGGICSCIILLLLGIFGTVILIFTAVVLFGWASKRKKVSV